jgi:ABC-type Fe3+/spermidine/putrescine transport system ATPase subunit
VGITTVLVTHEQEEAFDLGDRIALLQDGRLEQFGTPDELYDTPATPFVAGFIGRASSLRARVAARHGNEVEVELGPARLSISGGNGFEPGASVIIMARPESFAFAAIGDNRLQGTITGRRFAGGSALFTVTLTGGQTLEVSAEPQAGRVGQEVSLAPAGRGLHMFPLTTP